MKVTKNGEITFLRLWGDNYGKDKCKAVSFDTLKYEVVFLLETTSPSLRPDFSRYASYSANDADILMIVMK